VPAEETVTVARRWLDAFNARDIDGLIALYAEGAVHHSPKLRERRPETGGVVGGKLALRAWWAEAFARLPGLRYVTISLCGDAARVWMEYRRVVPGEKDLLVAEVLVIGPEGTIIESRVYHG
jgi:hypothetical protein